MKIITRNNLGKSETIENFVCMKYSKFKSLTSMSPLERSYFSSLFMKGMLFVGFIAYSL